jgi:hypothetical protein
MIRWMPVIPAHRALRGLAVAASLVTSLSACGLGAELDREAHPAAPASAAPSRTPVEEPSAGMSAASPSPSVAACPPSGLRAAAGPVDAAMGARGMTVTVTDCAQHAVHLNGYPALRVLDEDHEPVDVEVVQGMGDHTGVPDPGPRPLTLRPGEAARTVLFWRNTVTSVTTPAVRAPWLAVGADAHRPAGTVHPDGGIDLGTTGHLFTTAWQAGDRESATQHP